LVGSLLGCLKGLSLLLTKFTARGKIIPRLEEVAKHPHLSTIDLGDC
jgi:hypothetical protein